MLLVFSPATSLAANSTMYLYFASTTKSVSSFNTLPPSLNLDRAAQVAPGSEATLNITYKSTMLASKVPVVNRSVICCSVMFGMRMNVEARMSVEAMSLHRRSFVIPDQHTFRSAPALTVTWGTCSVPLAE